MNPSSIVTSLMTAVEANPDDLGLRLLLANAHMDNGSAKDALTLYVAILAADPTVVDALRGAAGAAEALGDAVKASAYRKMFLAMGGEPDSTPVSEAADQRVRSVNAASDDESHTGLRLIDGGRSNVIPISDTPRETTITLDDVAGLKEVKRRIDLAFLQPIRNPELTRQYGKKAKGGLLLYGPPGCGKTYIARALAGELRAGFVPVRLNDVLDMYLGESQKRLHAIFSDARQRAPSLLFFDELDALGLKRARHGGSETRDVVNQLLTELDGVDGAQDELFVLGATNLPWDVDDALKRPGRFDRSVFVCPPDADARQRILEMALADRPVDAIDIAGLVKRTRGFSGADVAYLCEMATEAAMEDAVTTGKMAPIGKRHFKIALKDVRASVGTWFETASNYTKFANASGQYNDLAEYIKARNY